MSEKKFKLALCQIRTEMNQETTMREAERMVRESAQNGADIVMLP